MVTVRYRLATARAVGWSAAEMDELDTFAAHWN